MCVHVQPKPKRTAAIKGDGRGCGRVCVVRAMVTLVTVLGLPLAHIKVLLFHPFSHHKTVFQNLSYFSYLKLRLRSLSAG